MSIIKESLRIFLQGAPENMDPVDVYDTLVALDYVESVHGLHIWSVSSTEIFLSCHICIGQENDNGDLVIQEINTILNDRYGINHTTLQIENSQLCEIVLLKG